MRAILLILLLSVSTAAFSQISKGQWMIGGEMDFSSQNTEGSTLTASQDYKSSMLEISPGFGYFFADNFAAGLRMVFGSSKTKQDLTGMDLLGNIYVSHSEMKSTPVGVSPFVRYYFLPAQKKLNLFADLSYGYTSEKQRMETYTYYGPPQQPGSGATSTINMEKVSGHSFSIAAGPAVFIGARTSFELAIGYAYGNLKSSSFKDVKANRVFLGTGFNIHF